MGSQGKVIVISEDGEIESAVLMLKRGCEVALLSGGHKRPKVLTAAKRLLKHHHRIELFLAPKISLKADPSLRFYLEKVFLRKVASLLAEEIGAEAIVSGETIKDISRIGLRGLKLIDSVASLEVFYPLLLEEPGKIDVDQNLYNALEKAIKKLSVPPDIMSKLKKIVLEAEE
ncbi:MAG: hypothetical protein QXH08_06230 [Candidatus Hadarchaeales archaeon]